MKGLLDAQIYEITGVSRSAYYRRKKRLKLYGLQGLISLSKRPKRTRQSNVSEHVRELIMTLRRENPTYGKFKIWRILRRDHNIAYSESTVGRVLTSLMLEGKVKRYTALTKIRKKRKFNNHAQPWQYGMKAQELGELIQIDHMSVHKNGMSIKRFQACDPISKVIIADAYTTASSSSAAKFLDKVISDIPYQFKWMEDRNS